MSSNELNSMDFFAGLQGSTMLETSLLLAHVPVSFLLVRATSGNVVNEAVCVLGLLLIAFTVLSTRHDPSRLADNPLSAIQVSWRAERLLAPETAAMPLRLVLSLAVLLVIALVSHLSRRTLAIRRGALSDSARPEFISFYRSCMMLATCIAILAVDFPLFPRRFAKTESFGVSLMDLGVGGFVFSMALVSPQARGVQPPLAQSLGSVLPLTVLGVVRLVLTRGASLDVHVSEYGVHWNFFMTLATVAIFVALLRVPTRVGAAIGVALMVGYQLSLSFGGVTEYILEYPRTNVLHANKEGLCSWIGYLAIYLIGAQCGSWFLQQQRSTTQSRWQALQWTAVVTALCWILTFLVAQFVQPPSRRMANAAYVLITLATNLQTLLLCAVASFVTPPVPLPLVDAVNANQLLVFLAANLLTGAVNLTIRAREQSNTVALMVLSGYLFVVCAVALTLARLGWKLRI